MINNKRKIINEAMKFIEDPDYGYFYDTEHNVFINKKEQIINNHHNKKKHKVKSYIELSNKIENNLTGCTYLLVIICSVAITVYLYQKGVL